MQALQLSGLMDPTVYQDPEWIGLHDELETYSVDKHIFYKSEGNVYRKGWEFTQCLYGLHRLGAIHPEATGLGVGVGREPTIFYLSDRVREVVATDLYGNTDWSENEGSAAILTAPQQFCPRSIDTSRIRFEIADGTNLPFAADSFDFCWSLSSIEHFGGHAGAAAAVREMARVVRPGGVVCIATEFILLDEQHHPEFFNRRDFEIHILNATENLKAIDRVRYDGTLPVEYMIDSVPFPQNIDRRRRHVVLNNGAIQWTSIIVFMRRL